MKPNAISLLLAVVATALVAPSMRAQLVVPTAVTNQNRTGDLPFSTSVGTDVEHVDIGSGDLLIRIPIEGVKGRGLDHSFFLRYDGHVWLTNTVPGGDAPPYQDWEPEPALLAGSLALGWHDNSSQLTRAVVQFACDFNVNTYYTSYIFTDPNGVKHPLAEQFNQKSYCPVNRAGPDLTGQGMWSRSIGIAAVLMSDGANFTPSDQAHNSLGGQWTDANGNINGDGPGTLDTLGRTLVSQQNGTNQISYQVRDSNGALQTYTVNLSTINLATQFNVSGDYSTPIVEYNGTATVVSSIVLPNTRSYQFHYENGSYGALTEIDLPTGGSVTYTWATLSDGARTYRYVASRTVNVGGASYTWNFSRSGSDQNITATVTDPLNNQTVYGVDNGSVTSAKFYNGAASGNPLRQYVIDYVWDDDPWYYPSQRGPGNEAQQVGMRPIRITTTLDNGQVSKKEFDYDSFSYDFNVCLGSDCGPEPETFTTSRGNVTEIREFDWTGTLVRRTKRSYDVDSSYISYNIVNKILRELGFVPDPVEK